MNIWAESLEMEKMQQKEKNNKPEDVSHGKNQEELQHTIANGRRCMGIKIINSTENQTSNLA